MAVNPNQELIWQGRTHIGDEPGVYGDASYSGICAELPITIHRSNPEDGTDAPFTLVLETEGLETFVPFPGHLIEVTIYEPDPITPNHSVERVLATDRFTGGDHNVKNVSVTPGSSHPRFYLSIRLRADTTVTPGFYDDFVWTRLSLVSNQYFYYANFGFEI